VTKPEIETRIGSRDQMCIRKGTHEVIVQMRIKKTQKVAEVERPRDPLPCPCPPQQRRSQEDGEKNPVVQRKDAQSATDIEVANAVRVVACVIALPILTVFMDFSGLLGGFLAERVASGLSFQLYLTRAFSAFEWSNFVPPTIKTAVFGLVIGTVSSYFGYTTNRGAQGVGQAATNSVVVSSLLIIVSDVVLIKGIFFLFPDSAL